MFKTRITDKDGQVTVALSGDLDTNASKVFAADVEKVLPLCSKEMTLDLSELEFISSSGMRQLLVVRKEVQALGGSISATGLSEDIRQIFKLSGFDSMFGLE